MMTVIIDNDDVKEEVIANLKARGNHCGVILVYSVITCQLLTWCSLYTQLLDYLLTRFICPSK